MGRHNQYQPKGGDALRLGVKAGMVRVWVVVKLCDPLVTHGAISIHFRDKWLIYKELYKFICLLYLRNFSYST